MAALGTQPAPCRKGKAGDIQELEVGRRRVPALSRERNVDTQAPLFEPREAHVERTRKFVFLGGRGGCKCASTHVGVISMHTCRGQASTLNVTPQELSTLLFSWNKISH